MTAEQPFHDPLPVLYMPSLKKGRESAMTDLSPEALSENEKTVLLTLASLPPEYATDRIYFEKALFLLTRSGVDELDVLADSFEAYDRGPYSPLADDTLLRLGDLKLLRKGTMSITPDGTKLARDLLGDPGFKRVVEASTSMWSVLRAQRFSRRDLLYLVYSLYPDYAKASKMKPDEVASDRMEHFTIREADVPDGNYAVFQSDKGNSVKVAKKDGRLVMSPVAP